MSRIVSANRRKPSNRQYDPAVFSRRNMTLHAAGKSMSDNEPVAWAIVGADNDAVLDSHLYHTEAVATRWATQHGDRVVALYRQPQTCPYVVGRTTLHCSLTPLALTDAEREAVACAAESYADNDDDEDCANIAATLRALLERTE